jgi:hypothetical protein
MRSITAYCSTLMPASLMIGHHFATSAFVEGAERRGGLQLGRGNVLAEARELLAHDRIRHRLHGGRAEFGVPFGIQVPNQAIS